MGISNRVLEFNGKTQCMAAWAEEFDINVGTLSTRLKLGWSTERALTTEVINAKINKRRKAT
jgi:hypothetical protein